VEAHLTHRQASRRQESKTPLTEDNPCPSCTSGTDATVLAYPALQTTYQSVNSRQSDSTLYLPNNLPKCELTPARQYTVPTHPCGSPPTEASQWHSWCHVQAWYHECVSHFYPLCAEMCLFVGSRPMWWTAARRTVHASRATAGTVSIVPLRRYVQNSPHIWHTSNHYPVSDKSANGVLREAGRSLRSECHTVSRYTCQRNFINTHNKSTAFPAPLFTKLTNGQQRYLESSPAEFHTNRLWNMESTSRNWSKAWLLLSRFH
jgi:hypothetical protein